MSEENPQPPEGQEPESKTFDAEYVDKLRKEAAKYRTEAKANADAATRLAAIEEAKKTEEQKAADRLAAVEAKATEAERRALRFEIASEFKLSPEDAKALEHVPSESGMREVAERLAARDAESKRTGNRVPREGSTPSAPKDNPLSAYARGVFGRDD